MNYLSAVLLVVLAVIGVMSLIRDLSLYLFRYKSNNQIMLITPIEGKCKNAEMILRSTATKIRWVSLRKNDYIICLDCDMDSETRQICEKICTEYGFIKIMNKQELINQLSDNKTPD